MVDGLRAQVWEITGGATLCEAVVDKGGRDIIGFHLDANFAGTQLTFTGRNSLLAGGAIPAPADCGDITWEGTAVVVACVAGDRVGIDPMKLSHCRFIAVTSDAGEAGTEIQPIFRDFT